MVGRINKVTTQTKTYEAPVVKEGKLSYSLYDSNGNKVGQTYVDPGTDMSGAEDKYFTKNEKGLWDMSNVPKTSISLDTTTGDIVVKAPKSDTNTEQFKKFIDVDQLKEYSKAYKMNHDYKLQIQEKNEETGNEETKEITIPEYIERLNSSLTNYFENLYSQKSYSRQLANTYGDKSKNLTNDQIVMSMQGAKGAKALYLPDTVLSAASFAQGKQNPLKQLKDLRSENGEISAEEFAKVWKRENFGREEVAALMAVIDGTLQQSNWDEDTYYTDADGNSVYNRGSAEEAAKLLSLKNYILNNNPEAQWYEQVGTWIESASINFSSAVTNVFANLAVIGEGALDLIPGVEAHAVLDWKTQSDQTMSNFNAINAQAWDAVANAQIWGYLAGTVVGTKAIGQIGKFLAGTSEKVEGATTIGTRGLAEQSGAISREPLMMVNVKTGAMESAVPAAFNALSPETYLALAVNAVDGEAVSLGTRLWMSSLTLANKAAMAINTAMSAISGAKNMSVMTEYLYDTIHDAILYDGSTLRSVIDALREDGNDENKQQAINFWLGQFAENAKFWVPIGVAKTSIKYAGKTDLGKAANAVSTRLVNKIAAGIGDKKQAIKNNLAGGSVTKKLENEIEEALKKNQFTKANRLQKKLDIENWNALTRGARKRLGNLELKWDGRKLTDESLKEFQDYVSDIKAYENGIDAYNRDIINKVDQMVTKQIDPSTGRHVFLNPELGGANTKATMYYWDLVDLNKKYNLVVAKDSMLNQDVIDFWVNSYYKGLADSFATRGGLNAADAQKASETLQKNIDALSNTVPKEIQDYITNMIGRKVYQGWYFAQNEYGVSKGLLNRRLITSYQDNPIWQENGYMPIRVQQDVHGHWVDEDGRIDAVIEQDWDALKFSVAEGQHYVDPEMVRQSRLRKMAQAEVNKDLFKAYNGYSNSATNITMVSGAETEYVDTIRRNEGYIEKSVEESSTAAFSENVNVEPQMTPRRAPIKNEVVPQDTRSAVVASMSPSQVESFLVGERELPRRGAKLTDNVTAENYDEWYNTKLNNASRNYLRQQYARFGDSSAKPIKTKLDESKMTKRQKKTQKVISDALGERRSPNDFETLQKAMASGGDDFEAGLQRAHLIGDDGFADSSVMNEAARNLSNGKEAFYQGVIVAKIKGETKNILTLDTNHFWNDMSATIRNQLNNYVSSVVSDPGVKAAVTALAETANGADDTARYVALQQLKKKGLDNAHKAIDAQIDKMKELGKLEADQKDLLKKKAHELLDDMVETELDESRRAMQSINPDLVNSKDIYDKAKELNKKIVGAEDKVKAGEYIMYLDHNGRQVYAQVDPAFASLFNTRARITKAEASAMAKFNAFASRAFRYGTTSVNLAAFGNQMFRDFGNAVLVGGSWQTIKTNADNMRDVFGQRIVDQIKAFDPDNYETRQLQKIAEETGQTMNEAAVSRELMRGASIAGTTTETSLYRDFMKQAYGSDTDTLLNNAKGKLQELWEKYDPDKYVNGKRENYLRNRVYAQSLNDALTQGYSLSQARVYAEFAMNNATTNFSRQLYHMQAIADSTPYFRAAINGTKSFWRMWSLDPVGISGRIMGGLILPVMFLTGASLGSEKNRKIYQNIPEYQKKDSLVFVFNGEAVSIPLPQELSPLVAPFRQFVEYLHGSNQNDFWELMTNDLLGFSPYDLTGFTAIDYDKMIEDPTFFDRTSRGFARVFSQMAPIPVKSAYMIASGTDPYTGKWLRDPSYAYWNNETNSIETMDYYQSTFAGVIAKLFPKMNPAIADKVISGVLGTTGSNLLGDLTTFFMEGPEAAALVTGKNIIEQVTKPITVEQYDLVDAVWKRAVRQLTAEKEELLADERMKRINNELVQTKDPEKRQKLLAERQTLADGYKERVVNMVERLSTQYHGTFDRTKFAAVVALLNFDSDALYQSGSQYSSDIASEVYWNGRDEAIHTMERMGITGTSDMSIFGYLTTDKDGNPVMKYSSPVAIMDMESQWRNQSDVNAANIKALLSQNNMYDAHKSISEQISKIYDSKKNLTSQDRANIEAIQINWNAQLAKVVAPYVAQMTPEAAINNTTVMNLLYPYVEVPNSWEVNDKNRHASLGSRGNRKRAYYDSWIKSMFSVNDAYKGQY